MSEPIISDRRAVYRTLGPGERIIDGRVYYSAAWLDPAPDRTRTSLKGFTCARTPPTQFVPEKGQLRP